MEQRLILPKIGKKLQLRQTTKWNLNFQNLRKRGRALVWADRVLLTKCIRSLKCKKFLGLANMKPIKKLYHRLNLAWEQNPRILLLRNWPSNKIQDQEPMKVLIWTLNLENSRFLNSVTANLQLFSQEIQDSKLLDLQLWHFVMKIKIQSAILESICNQNLKDLDLGFFQWVKEKHLLIKRVSPQKNCQAQGIMTDPLILESMEHMEIIYGQQKSETNDSFY